MHRVTQAELDSLDRLYQVPIGKPVPGWECFLYDDETDTVITQLDASDVSAGITRSTSGICYVRGPGVLKAYLNRADLTQAAFLSAHDKLPVPLFRVGDVCHYNSDGALVFEGRCFLQSNLWNSFVFLILLLIQARPSNQNSRAAHGTRGSRGCRGICGKCQWLCCEAHQTSSGE
jgi:non-ribosomal peptide synthetase component F